MNEKTYNVRVVIDATSVMLLTPGQKMQSYSRDRLPPSILVLVKSLLIEDSNLCSSIASSLKEAPNEA